MKSKKITKFYDKLLFLQLKTTEKEKEKTCIICHHWRQLRLSQKNKNKRELDMAFSKLKANKCPGTIILKPFIWPLLKAVAPQSLKEAEIAVIPQDVWNKENYNSCCLIIIQNIDYKLITSIMCKRIQHLLSDLIHEEQMGFVKGQPTQINIR